MAGGFLLSEIGIPRPTTAMQAPAPTATSLHLSTTVARQQRDDTADTLQRSIIVHGMETGSAGFHLLRPPSDPQWSKGFGRLHPTLDFRWFDTPVKYSNIEYQRLVPISMDPAPAFAPTALVSQARLFTNALGSAVIAQDVAVPVSSATYRVEFNFSNRGIAAMQALLMPTSAIVNGRQDDWYRISRPVGGISTPMVIVVVSQNTTYLPIPVAALLEGAAQGNRTVVVANGLSNFEALELATRLNVP